MLQSELHSRRISVSTAYCNWGCISTVPHGVFPHKEAPQAWALRTALPLPEKTRELPEIP